MKKIKTLLFFLLFGIIFFIINKIFVPEWNYPLFAGNVTDTMATFYHQEKNIDDVIFLGTSHGECGVSPMRIYDKRGLSTYNLSTSGQPIGVSYYLLIEALKSQHPKAVMLDASNLFRDDDDLSWRYVIDSMPLSINKIKMCISFASLYDSYKSNILFKRLAGVLFPVCQYHDGWSDINSIGVSNKINNNYITAGFWPFPTVYPYYADTNYVDVQSEILSNDIYYYRHIYSDGGYEDECVKDSLYSPQITEDRDTWLRKIVSLCETNGITLCLYKVPAEQDITVYPATWTEAKSEITHKIADDLNIRFYDLQYDIDLEIDNTKDYSTDIGHLNILGANKVSDELARYLHEDLKIQCRTNKSYDNNMNAYHVIEETASMEMTESFSDYADCLMSLSDWVDICIVVSDDISEIVDGELLLGLEALGINDRIISKYEPGDAYIAYIKSGKVIYEEVSNRTIDYTIKTDDMTLKMISKGHNVGKGASVSFDGKTNVCSNANGINFVILDSRTHKVIDSANIWGADKTKALHHDFQMEHLANKWFDL